MRFMEAYESRYQECAWLDFTPFMADAQRATGLPKADARIVSEVLIESDKRGIDSHGMGMTAVRHSTQYGVAGCYALMAIKEGLLGSMGTHAQPSISPSFGVEHMLDFQFDWDA